MFLFLLKKELRFKDTIKILKLQVKIQHYAKGTKYKRLNINVLFDAFDIF